MTAKARLIQKTGTMDLGLVKAAAGQVNFNYLFNESLQKLLRTHRGEQAQNVTNALLRITITRKTAKKKN